MSLSKSHFIGLPNRNQNPFVMYHGKYAKMTTHQRIRFAAKESSDNGRCWWIEHWLLHNPVENAYKVHR